MSQTIVVDKVTGARYRLDDRTLGRGGTASVRLGRLVSGGGAAEVAVKIAHAGMSQEGLDKFWAELQILEMLQDEGAQPGLANTPWAHKAERPDAPDLAIMVMELIPDDWQLTRCAREQSGRLPEELALASGLQYAGLLAAMHRHNITSRGDRKATDLRWDPSYDRLVVLDWNRAALLPADARAQQELIRQDVRGFGRLWANLMLGRALPSLPEVDDTTQPEWAGLSRGWRVILSRALGARPGWGYQSADELLADLMREQDRVRAFLGAGPAGLIVDTRKKMITGQKLPETDAGQRSQVADDILTVVDLARRAGQLSTDQIDSLEELETWAKTEASRPDALVDEAVRRAIDNIGLWNYEEAERAIRETAARLPGQPPLRLLRWQLVAHAGVEGNRHGLDMSAPVTALKDCLQALESLASPKVAAGEQSGVEGALSDFLRAERSEVLAEPEPGEGPSGAAVRQILRPLRLEIEIRRELAARTAAATDASDRTAALSEGALDAWRELKSANPVYGDSLLAGLPRLDRALAALELEGALPGERARYQEEFEAAVAHLRQVLADADPAAWPPGAGEALDRARQALSKLRCLGPAPGQPAPAQVEFLLCAERINDHIAAGELDSGLVSLKEAIAKDLAPEYAGTLVACCRGEALERVSRIVDAGEHWPDELAWAEAVMINLRDLPPSPGMDGEVARIENDLRAWRDDLLEYRKRFNLPVGGWPDAWLQDSHELLLQDPSNTDIDAALTELKEREDGRIEVLDRRGLPPNLVENCRVHRLLALRRLARLEAESGILKERLHDLAAEIQGLGGVLADMPDFDRQFAELDRAINEAETLAAELNGRRPGRAQNEARKLIKHFATLQAELDGLKQRWPGVESHVDLLQRSADDLRGRLISVEETIASVTGTEGRVRTLIERVPRILDLLQGPGSELAEATARWEQKVGSAEALIVRTWVAIGLQAAREFRLEGDYGAARALEQAQKIVNSLASAPAALPVEYGQGLALELACETACQAEKPSMSEDALEQTEATPAREVPEPADAVAAEAAPTSMPMAVADRFPELELLVEAVKWLQAVGEEHADILPRLHLWRKHVKAGMAYNAEGDCNTYRDMSRSRKVPDCWVVAELEADLDALKRGPRTITGKAPEAAGALDENMKSQLVEAVSQTVRKRMQDELADFEEQTKSALEFTIKTRFEGLVQQPAAREECQKCSDGWRNMAYALETNASGSPPPPELQEAIKYTDQMLNRTANLLTPVLLKDLSQQMWRAYNAWLAHGKAGKLLYGLRQSIARAETLAKQAELGGRRE